MHIQKVIIKDFRCFEHLEVNLDPDINIFVGNNGSGKSALLDGIAAAMYPYVVQIQQIAGKKYREASPVLQRDLPAQKKDNERGNQAEFTVSATGFPDWTIVYKKPPADNDDERIKVSVSSSSISQEGTKQLYSAMRYRIDEFSVLAYYKGNRHLNDIAYVKNVSHQSLNRFTSLNHALDATSSFTDMANWFFVREFQELREAKEKGNINLELPDLKRVRNAISSIIAPNTHVYFSQIVSANLMVEWEMETGEKREFLLSQLSAGYRHMLALVMDFARRLAQANPHMENPLAAEAILMIDELDLHLHPTWQQKIIPDLKKVFPNTQIIATTHSPEVVTTVKQNQVKILEDYQIKECPSPTRGMKSSDIVRYVLGLSDLRPDTEESRTLTQLFEAIDNGQLEEAKRLRKELQDWESFDPDMTRADMQIRRLERRNAV
jgi:predicted ATP-binding protein involved in virulence